MNHLNHLFRRSSPWRCAWILACVLASWWAANPAGAADKPAARAAPAADKPLAGAAPAVATISVTVTGAVASPGAHSLPSGSHLSDALKAAAPSLDADLAEVEVRHADDARQPETLNYLMFLADKTGAGNILLADGDKIQVLHRRSASIDVSVRGQVVSPGRFTLPAQSTFLDALNAAKGLTADADRKGIVIQHANDVAQNAVDLDAAQAHSPDPTANPVLNDGDIVVAHSVARPNVFTITGAVVRPGEYPLRDTPLTLADAIGKAGGLSDRPHLNDVSILRTDASGKVTTVKVKAADAAVQAATVIQAGDNITIPQGSPPQRVDPLQVIGLVISLVAVFGHR